MDSQAVPFKKPILIGKRGKLPKKISGEDKSSELAQNEDTSSLQSCKTLVEDEIEAEEYEESSKPSESNVTLPYTEPPWSASPPHYEKYGLDILKQGAIIGCLKLDKKSFWVFGRLPQCDVALAHPTISRYHAVLQYRAERTDDNGLKGFHLYDLGSTHGTWLNKTRIRPHNFVRVHVGHMIKLGCSTRSFILTGPADDEEEESELSVSELKQQRIEERNRKDQLIEEAKRKAEQERIANEKLEEERGIDWGMGDDADEETDLADNPYAQTNNEDLYIDDPKKALRGFMEREGVSFEYDCTEQGIGQFLCKVTLPIDDERGRPIVAEVLHKGKKKEAVVQCALESCRILDRFGVLRQANHESKKRKAKNWVEADFYDSDDDTFLDRTGTVERKRLNRMKTKLPQKAETYQSLLEKEIKLVADIKHIERELALDNAAKSQQSDFVDSLDSFMAELKEPKLDKQRTLQLKTDLIKLKQEHANTVKLLIHARPANLPALVNYSSKDKIETFTKSKLPIFGKRLKVKVDKPQRDTAATCTVDNAEDGEEVEKSEELKTESDSPKLLENESRLESFDHIQSVKEVGGKDKLDENELEKRRKKNQRRILHRMEKQESEKMKGYEEDARKEDYNMWVPPQGQTGDGRTSLNEKFGY